MARIFIGTAGWTIPRDVAEGFPADGHTLTRYAARLNAAEINSSFYQPHKPATYERWAAITPPGFRLAVKAPRAITHYARLAGCEALVAEFLGQIAVLGERLGPVLVQLPPSLAFDPARDDAFFGDLRTRFGGLVACEPRHATWFGPEAQALLTAHRIARVAADPARHPSAGAPGGWPGLAYWRLHGSPVMYRSAYGDAALDGMAERLATEGEAERWCVFDNTASGAALPDALSLRARVASGGDVETA